MALKLFINGRKIFRTTLYLFLIFSSASAQDLRVKCIENGRFYRDPDRPPHTIWTLSECSKYFLCLEGEVFDFRCSTGLLFDINRQICDLKLNVDNCDIAIIENVIRRPLLDKTDCPEPNHLGCADGTCLPLDYFCDGSVDCPDGSDEGYCDPNNDPKKASSCDPLKCRLPECFCSADGTHIPGKLDPSEVPQMIIITFDDAVNYENWNLYNENLFKQKNPNGCPIKSTFFVSHQYNNYQQTQKLWNAGHEIAVHSITHRGPDNWWSFNATIEDWFDEMVGQANIINKFSNIRMSEIRGMRVPFLRVGWNRQFLMMKEFGFVYDSSMVAPFSNPPLWPYTLDHTIPHKCTGTKQNCPSRAYPGVWEMVINQLEMADYTCAMVDSCPVTLSGDDIYKMLMHNFKRHYLTNRAPYGLYFHSTWFKKAEYLNAFQRFVSDVLKQPDVWFVTNWQALNWMKTPTPLHQLNSFEPWGCNKSFERSEIACNIPNICKLYSRIFQQDRFLYTCFQCPESYPWIRNEFGTV